MDEITEMKEQLRESIRIEKLHEWLVDFDHRVDNEVLHVEDLRNMTRI